MSEEFWNDLGFGGLCLVFVAVGGSRLWQARRLRRRGVTTQAVVTAQSGMAAPGGGRYQAPVLVFTTPDGRTIEATSSVGTDYSEFLPGRTVSVTYDPADPTRISIPEQENWVYWVALAAGLLMFAVLGCSKVFGDRIGYAALGIPLFLGAVFTAVGYFGIRRAWRLKHGGRTEGVVVGAIPTESRNGFTVWHPVVRYPAPNGSTMEMPSTHGTTSRPPAPGTPVPVCYDPANPQRMMLAYEHAPVVFWLFAAFGILVMLIGAAVIIIALS